MIDGITLVPMLALVAGALLCLRPPARLGSRYAYAVLAAVLVAFSAALAMAILLWRDRPQAWQLSLSPWSGTIFQSDPALAVDATTAIVLLLVCLCCLVATLAALSTPRGLAALGGPLLIGAASALMVAARTPLGLVSAWLLLDVALFFGARTRRRALLASHLGLLLVLAALIDLPPGAEQIDPALLSNWSRFCLIAAATVRMGLYPFWWPVPRTPAGGMWQACTLRLGPTIAGASLVLAVAHMPGSTAGAAVPILLPGLVAVAFGALLTWLASGMPNLLDWSTTYYAGLLVLAASLGTAIGEAVALLLLIDLVIGRCAAYASQGLGSLRAARVASGLALLSLAGLPPSLGFAARWFLYRELLLRERVGLLILVVAATGLVVARFPDFRSRAGLPTQAGRRLALGLAGLASLAWLLGLGLGWLQPTLTDLTGAAASSFVFDQRLVIAGAIGLPIAVGLLLRWLRGGSAGSLAESQRAMVQVLRLTDAFDAVRSGLIRAGRLVHDGLGFTQGQRTMAWTFLAAAATGATMLAAPPLTSDAAPVSPLAGIALVASVLVATLMVISAAPALTLAALAGGYGVVAIALLAASADAVAAVATLAVIKTVAGIVVVAILVVSVLQTTTEAAAGSSTEHRPRRAARGKRFDLRVLPLVALATAVVLALGIPSVALPELLPPALLHVALILIFGGALTVVFARAPLRLAGGVLLALAGFELVYTRLDPGLFIAGSLAVFQLAFAIVAAAFVGLDPPVDTAG